MGREPCRVERLERWQEGDDRGRIKQVLCTCGTTRGGMDEWRTHAMVWWRRSRREAAKRVQESAAVEGAARAPAGGAVPAGHFVVRGITADRPPPEGRGQRQYRVEWEPDAEGRIDVTWEREGHLRQDCPEGLADYLEGKRLREARERERQEDAELVRRVMDAAAKWQRRAGAAGRRGGGAGLWSGGGVGAHTHTTQHTTRTRDDNESGQGDDNEAGQEANERRMRQRTGGDPADREPGPSAARVGRVTPGRDQLRRGVGARTMGGNPDQSVSSPGERAADEVADQEDEYDDDAEDMEEEVEGDEEEGEGMEYEWQREAAWRADPTVEPEPWRDRG